jgi:xanthosine utilization system XapX-like protein
MQPSSGSIFRTLAASIRPWVILSDKRWSSYQVCGYTGLLLGFAQSLMLVRHLGLSQLALLGITGVVSLTFVVLVMVTKILIGEEVIVYYHHEIGTVAMTATLLRVTGQPVLPYLDITVLGIGLFLACGRLGCLAVGCCHGRPSRWGFKYNYEHARAGFPSYLVGVRLFPVQAVESHAALAIVLAGITLLIRGSAPGRVLEWYVMSYGVARFCLEFMRGDAERPYWLGFSEAQWTSLILMACVVRAEYSRVLPFELWHFQATVGVAAAMIAIALIRHFRKTPKHQLLHPRHIREFSEAAALVSRFSTERPNHIVPNSAIHIAHTSLGIRISAGLVRHGATLICHYTLSSEKNSMTTQAARCLAKLIERLKYAEGSAEVVHGGPGVFHAVIQNVMGIQKEP